MTIQEIENQIVAEFSNFEDWLDKYNYIIEVENKNGVTDKLLEKLGAIEDVRILGRFRVAEKQTESHTG